MATKLRGMSVADVQGLLASTGYYRGAIDGDDGPATWAAVGIIERNAGQGRDGWSRARRLIAAAQVVLAAQGHEPGFAGGYAGANTQEALTAWRSAQVDVSASVERAPAAAVMAPTAGAGWPLQRDMEGFFGPAGGPACTNGRCELPFPFLIDWNDGERVTGFRCHEKVAARLTAIFADAAQHFGEAEFRRLRLDRWGGCFNHRRMRGGEALSVHAWGAAVDLDPSRNQLRWGVDRAAFARPEYAPWWRIVMARGAVPAG
ncbi:MAG TPA: peptidoglycan-binding domain-containing protein [Paracoccus sp. (in: a-proteobacteria)]|nr:peptidoglycan-binding domain-containing protein [Paracoccus sp. (in: a-proteobacteria)]